MGKIHHLGHGVRIGQKGIQFFLELAHKTPLLPPLPVRRGLCPQGFYFFCPKLSFSRRSSSAPPGLPATDWISWPSWAVSPLAALSVLGGIDPKLLQRLLPLAGELAGGGGDDERMQLLYALRPFLKPERRDKVERAARTARLIRVGKKLLADLGDGYV